MADVGSANVRITADSSQAQSEVRGFQSVLGGIGRIATGVTAGLAIFEGVKNTFSTLYDSTIMANASMEQYSNTLTIVQGSAQKAEETLAWVKDFAAQTPFEIPELVEATTRLEAYGITAQDVLGNVGDMASALGKPLMQAVEAVADAQTGELERLKEFGITKQMLIDEALRIGEGEIVNAKGQITNMEGLNKALFSIIENRYSGAMEIQSKSFLGMISNAKDSMGQLMITLSQPIFEDMKRGMQSVVPVMSALTSFVQGNSLDAFNTLKTQFSEETSHGIMQFFGNLREGFESFKSFILSFSPVIDNLKQIFISLIPVFGMVGGAIAVVWQVISAVLPPLLKFITDIAAAIVSWEGFIPIITGLAAGFAAFRIVGIVSGMFTALSGAVTLLLNPMARAILITTKILPIFKTISTFIMANPVGLIIAAVVALGVALYMAYQKSETFRNFVNGLWQSIVDAFNFVIQWATTTLPQWWNSVVTGFSNMVNGIVSFFQNLGTKIVGIWNGIIAFFTGLGATLSGIWNGVILAGIQNMINKMVAFFQNLGTRIMAIIQPFINYFVQSWENLKLLVLGIIQVFISLVTGNFEGLKLGLLAIWTAIKNQALNFWTLIKNTVINLAVALWNGAVNLFTSGKERVISLVSSLWTNTINFFRNGYTNAVKFVSDLKNYAIQYFSLLAIQAVQKISSMWTNTINFFRNGYTNAIKFVSDLKNYAIQYFSLLAIQAVQKIKGLWDGVVTWVGKIPSKFTEMKDNILKTVSSINLFDIGKNIISGLVNGLGSMLQSVKTKAQEIADAVEEAIRNQLKLKSPSRVLIDIGQDSGRGLIIGLDDMINQTFRKAEELGGTITNALSGSINTNDLLMNLPSMVKGLASNVGQSFPELQGLRNLLSGNGSEGQHIHYWNVNAEEISDVQKLIDIVNEVIQTVRSR